MGSIVLIWSLLLMVALTVWALALLALWQLERQTVPTLPHHARLKG